MAMDSSQYLPPLLTALVKIADALDQIAIGAGGVGGVATAKPTPPGTAVSPVVKQPSKAVSGIDGGIGDSIRGGVGVRAKQELAGAISAAMTEVLRPIKELISARSEPIKKTRALGDLYAEQGLRVSDFQDKIKRAHEQHEKIAGIKKDNRQFIRREFAPIEQQVLHSAGGDWLGSTTSQIARAAKMQKQINQNHMISGQMGAGAGV